MIFKVMKIEKGFSYKNISTFYQSHNHILKLFKTINSVPSDLKL